MGGPRLQGSLDDQIFTGSALLDAYEATLDRRYFESPEHAVRLAVERTAILMAAVFLIARKMPRDGRPRRAAQTISGFADAGRKFRRGVIVLDRMYGFTGNRLYHDWAEKTLEAFAGLAPQYGLFAASYGLAAMLARAPSFASRGAGRSRRCASAAELEKAANEIYRFGKAILRVTPETSAAA